MNRAWVFLTLLTALGVAGCGLHRQKGTPRAVECRPVMVAISPPTSGPARQAVTGRPLPHKPVIEDLAEIDIEPPAPSAVPFQPTESAPTLTERPYSSNRVADRVRIDDLLEIEAAPKEPIQPTPAPEIASQVRTSPARIASEPTEPVRLPTPIAAPMTEAMPEPAKIAPMPSTTEVANASPMPLAEAGLREPSRAPSNNLRQPVSTPRQPTVTSAVGGATAVRLAPLKRNDRIELVIATPALSDQPYMLQPGDDLSLEYLHLAETTDELKTNLDRVVTVAPDGSILLPHIGSVSAVGKSIVDLERSVNQEYKKVYLRPQVEVRLQRMKAEPPVKALTTQKRVLQVDSDGCVDAPLLGKVLAEGLSSSELNLELSERYRRVSPQWQIVVRNMDP